MDRKEIKAKKHKIDKTIITTNEILPGEVTSLVLSFLDYPTLFSCRLLCKDAKRRLVKDAIVLRRGYLHLYDSLAKIKEAILANDIPTIQLWALLQQDKVGKEAEEKEERKRGRTEDNKINAKEITLALVFACKHSKSTSVFDGGGGDHYAESAGAPRLLHKACMHRNFVAVKSLVEHGADKGVQYEKRGMTGLHITVAVAEDSSDLGECLKIIKFLLHNKASLRGIIDGGQNPLHTACKVGFVDAVKLLVEVIPDPHLSCYMYAHDPFFDCFSCAEPIHYALFYSAPTIILKVLLNKYPNYINSVIRSYNTTYYLKPIHLACVYATWEHVLVLLRHGGDILEKALDSNRKKWKDGLELAKMLNSKADIDTYYKKYIATTKSASYKN